MDHLSENESQRNYHKKITENEDNKTEIICWNCGKKVGAFLKDGRLSNGTPNIVKRVFDDGIKHNIITCWCGAGIKEKDRYRG